MISFGQFTWQELEPNNAESLTVLTGQPNGEILGYLEYPHQLVLSEDRGETWTVISEDPILSDALTAYDLIIEVGNDGEYYFGFDEVIYKLNRSTGVLEEWFAITFGLSLRLEDFAFLPNGNFVVGGIRSIQLYDAQQNLISSKDWFTHSAQFLIGEGNVHYVVQSAGASNYMARFSSDLSELSDHQTHSAPRNDLFEYYDGRLYSTESYSDDGINWTSYPNGISGYITVLSDGSLHLIDRDEVYVSDDRGVSFSSVGTLDNSFYSTRNDISIPLDDGSLMMYNSGNCSNSVLSHIEDGRALSRSVDISIGSPVNHVIEAYDQSSIFTGCSSYTDFIYPGSQGWQDNESSSSNFFCNFLSAIVTTFNGNVLSSEGCVSTDNGLTWSNNSDVFVSQDNSIFLKDEKCYLVDYYITYVSEDYGISWDTIGHVEDADIFDPPLAISSTGFIYTSDRFDPTLLKRTLDGEIVYSIPSISSSGAWIDMETAYSGPNVYGIHSQVNGPMLLAYSYDDGVTFSNYELLDIEYESTISLETDHLGNVYIYSDKGLWISQDEAQTWQNITPQISKYYEITDIDIGWDNHMYLATLGTGILRSSEPLEEPLTLNIIVFEDLNDNCTYDSGEPGLENLSIRIGDNVIKNTDIGGEAMAILLPGRYEITTDLRSDLYKDCNDRYEVVLEDENIELVVPISIVEECASLSIGATTPFLRRCFDNTYFVEIYNEGTVIARNVEVGIQLDEWFDYISSDMELISSDGDLYTFSVDDIKPRERRRYKLDFNLSCDSELGQAHYTEAYISYDNPCDVPSKFSNELECQENIGSYDPNDKAIYVGGIANKSIIPEDDRIEYLIRFQNTGTDTAFTVRIEDALDPAFDKNKIYPLSASHDYTWDVLDDKLNVYFDNILLVDSTRNEEASHGFINFAIGLQDNRPKAGDLINNTAGIYFDFNDPIITNTVESYYLCKHSATVVDTTICPDRDFVWTANGQTYDEPGQYIELLQSYHGCDSLVTLNLDVLDENSVDCIGTDIDELSDDGTLYLYPNPATDQLTIAYDGNAIPVSYSILELSSKLVCTGALSGNMIVDLSEINAGLYFINIQLDDTHSIMRKIFITD